jgi:hypothetical protein
VRCVGRTQDGALALNIERVLLLGLNHCPSWPLFRLCKIRCTYFFVEKQFVCLCVGVGVGVCVAGRSGLCQYGIRYGVRLYGTVRKYGVQQYLYDFGPYIR